MFFVEFRPSYFTFDSAQNSAHVLLPHLKTSHKFSIIALKADLRINYIAKIRKDCMKYQNVY